MADFLVWLSPTPPPPPVRRRWHWPGDGTIGLRQSDHGDVGYHRAGDAALVCIGRGHGRRGRRRRFIPGSRLAADLLEMLQCEGASALDRMRGDFAGAMIQPQTRRTLVWRDRFGRHPVQMVRMDDGWAVTSCPTAAARLSDRRPRWSLISTMIYGESTATDADVFDDLYRVRPAELVQFRHHDVVHRRRWWEPTPIDVDDPVHRMRNLLTDIGRLYGSVPHTLALSAGLDSAVLGAFATTAHPRSDAVTFTDPESPTDETAGARDTAAALDIDWQPFPITDHVPLNRLQDHRFPAAWGPAGHPDLAWKMPLHRRLNQQRGRRPVIYGNGADDVLWCPAGLWFETRWHRRDWPALHQAAQHVSATRWLRPAIRFGMRHIGDRPVRSLLPDWPQPTPFWCQPHRWLDHRPPVGRPLGGDTPDQRLFELRLRRLKTWRWEQITRSLAVEQRRSEHPVWTPFLDAEFWELTLSLNSEHLVEGGRQKAVLRRAAGDCLPRRCKTRPKLGGFDPVVERGLADRTARRVHQLVARSRLADTWPAFDATGFADAYEAYRHGGDGDTCRGSWAVWKTLATELWIRRRSAIAVNTSCTSTREVRP